MTCRRRLYRLRTRNTLILFTMAIGLVGTFLTYRTLMTQDGSSAVRSSLPVDKRKPRYQPAHPKLNFQLFAERKQIRSSLDKQFNSGLRVTGVKEVLAMLYPMSWADATEADEMAIILKDRMLNLDLHSPMECRQILTFRIQGSLGSSRRKYIERLDEPDSGNYNNYYNENRYKKGIQTMAIKSQALDVQTKIACMKQKYDPGFCGPMGNYFLMREVFLFRYLQHPNLIRMLGYCLRGDQISTEMYKKGVVMLLEEGVPMTSMMVDGLSWVRRVQLALDVASLLEYLQSSPLGSVGLPHVELRDFVLVDRKTLKLVDLDEAQLGEKSCSGIQDCVFQGTDLGVACIKGQCLGLNVKINLKVAGSFLELLLSHSPAEERDKVEEVLKRIQHLEITPTELVNFLVPIVEKNAAMDEGVSDPEGYQRLRDKVRDHLDNQVVAHDEDEDDDDVVQLDDNRIPHADSVGSNAAPNPQPEVYSRQESANYPGQYDYTCPDSRVLWGCVMTFDTLVDAMGHCTSDPACKAFVVFSSQPERESMLTVVFKDQTSRTPHVNLGTTLFVKKKSAIVVADSAPTPPPLQPTNNTEGQNEVKASEVKDMVEIVDPWAKVKEIQECLKHLRDNSGDALRSREKRLMAHMGLKGQQEKEWKRAVRVQKITSYSHIRPLSGEGSKGGSMLVYYNTSTPGHIVTLSKFMREDSPSQNHVLFALVHGLDRLLGLYHTPPVVEGFLENTVVGKFNSNASWHDVFASFVHADGTLRGLFVAPTPKVVKREELTLQPLLEMVSEVVPFDRTQKSQLEYILLWWLTHIKKAGNLHRGFKGHLIHVDADLAFQEPAVNYEGYFNHCQFPSVVYKLLMCFRCPQSEGSRICHLGQEAIRRLEATGFRLSDVHVANMLESDYPALINGAASKTVEMVDKCIHEFGREAVLY